MTSESILFHDKLTTTLALADAVFRRATAEEPGQMAQQELDSEARWVVSVGGVVAAAGDILFHYNRPFGDIFMKVGEAFRRRGVGTYLVQELKRVCYEGGSVPHSAMQSEEHRQPPNAAAGWLRSLRTHFERHGVAVSFHYE